MRKPDQHPFPSTPYSRRSFIRQMGFALAAVPLAGIVACGGGSTETSTSTTDTSSGSTGISGSWASGGTATLTANFSSR